MLQYGSVSFVRDLNPPTPLERGAKIRILVPLEKGDLGGFQPKPEQLTHDWLLTEPYWLVSDLSIILVEKFNAALSQTSIESHRQSAESHP